MRARECFHERRCLFRLENLAFAGEFRRTDPQKVINIRDSEIIRHHRDLIRPHTPDFRNINQFPRHRPGQVVRNNTSRSTKLINTQLRTKIIKFQTATEARLERKRLARYPGQNDFQPPVDSLNTLRFDYFVFL